MNFHATTILAVRRAGAVAIGGSTLGALLAFLLSRSNIHMEEVE